MCFCIEVHLYIYIYISKVEFKLLAKIAASSEDV